MAGVTIHSLSYQVVMDTRNFEKGAKLTRSELSQSKKIMRETRDPAQKLEAEYEKLAKMARAGAIDQQAYNEKIEEAKNKFDNATKSTGKYAKAWDKAGKAAKAGAVVIGAVTTGAVLLANKVKSLNTEFRDFERFGLKASESLGTYRVLAMETGLDVQELAEVTRDITVRLGEAAEGSGEAADQFEKLGVNVNAFMQLDPERQLRGFADAVSQMTNETEKLQTIDALLGDAGTNVFSVIDEGAGAFDRAAQKAALLGQNVTQLDVNRISEANKAVQQIETAWSRFTQELAIKSAPLVLAITDQLTQMLGGVGGNKEFDPNNPGFLTNVSNYSRSAYQSSQDNLKFISTFFTGTRQEFLEAGQNMKINPFGHVREYETKQAIDHQKRMTELQQKTNDYLSSMSQATTREREDTL